MSTAEPGAKPPAQQQIELVRGAYAAFSGGDLESFLRVFTPQAQLIEADCLPYGGRAVGIDAIREALLLVGSLWAEMAFDVERVMSDGEVAIALGRLTGRSRATQETMDMTLVEVWRFDGLLASSVEAVYADTHQALAALGSPPR